MLNQLLSHDHAFPILALPVHVEVGELFAARRNHDELPVHESVVVVAEFDSFTLRQCDSFAVSFAL